MGYRTGKYTVCRRFRASFRPDILQAGAVKGLSKRKESAAYKSDRTPGGEFVNRFGLVVRR